MPLNDKQKTSIEAAYDYLVARLKEPSTWAGIAVFIGIFGVSDDTLAKITSNAPAIVTALATLVAIFAPSHSSKAANLALQAQNTANDALDQANQAVQTSLNAAGAATGAAAAATGAAQAVTAQNDPLAPPHI